jgi:hypothetical protein
VLRRIFGPKRGGGWNGRILHSEVLHNSCALQNIVKGIKSRCAGHVARMGEMRNSYKILFGNHETKRPLGKLKRRWRIILEWILEKWNDSEQGPVAVINLRIL